jgi:anthranilate synthase
MIGFDGNMNTGLTLRTIRVRDGVAEVRAGATLLFDSDPEEEERETRMKASALLDAIRRPDTAGGEHKRRASPGAGKRVLLIDYEDSFVHTLANDLRQTGAEVVTIRHGISAGEIRLINPDLVVFSPGPGRPSDFNLARTMGDVVDLGLPTFGVCLGLQGMVEYFGGELDILEIPMHGKPSCVRVEASGMFDGLPETIVAGRYHSLYAIEDRLPAEIEVVARSDDGVVMAIQHRKLPMAAVQFHPESIMSLEDDTGMRLVENVVAMLTREPASAH